MNLGDEQFEQYLALIKRMYERMEKENSWPWVVVTEPDTPRDEDNQDEDD